MENDSVVLLNQVRSIDKSKLVKQLGTLNADTMQEVNRAIEISVGLVEI